MHGYAAWDGSPMQTNTIPRYPGLVATPAQASSRQADSKIAGAVMQATARQLQSQAALGVPPSPSAGQGAAGKGKVWKSGTAFDAAKID